MSDEIKISSGDQALIDAAKGKMEGLVKLTPDVLEDMRQVIQARTADIAERYPKLVEECPYETRLAVTAQVFRAIRDHAKEGGTYRYLIYDRLGFNSDAYLPLYDAGGLDISNMLFDLSHPNESP